jgi:hypothetical protein
MNKDKFTHRIEKLLISLHKQIVDIRDSENSVPAADMNQALGDVRSLYEEFILLNYFNSLIEDENSSLTIGPVPNQDKFSNSGKKEKSSAAVKAPEPAFVPESEPGLQNTVQAADNIHQPPPASHADVIPTFDKEPLPSENPAIALGELKELTLGDKLRLQKLDDLNKAISMADKFLFMNDLFKGENSAYKEALSVLNAMNNQADADRYLAQLSLQFGWVENAKTEKKFRELVSRKYV